MDNINTFFTQFYPHGVPESFIDYIQDRPITAKTQQWLKIAREHNKQILNNNVLTTVDNNI